MNIDFHMLSTAQVITHLKEETLLHHASLCSWKLWNPCLEILSKPEELFQLDRQNNNGLPAVCGMIDLLQKYGFSVETCDVEKLRILTEILFKNCLKYDEEMPFPVPKRYVILKNAILYTRAFGPPYEFE